MQEQIIARGHANVLGTHKTTIAITKDPDLTKAGDCIIGISADKACADLSPELKEKLKTKSKFTIIMRAGEIEEKITGYGSPDLILTNADDIVIRKSDYIGDRTLLINCDKACADLSREFIEKLKNPNQELYILFL